MVLKLEGKQSIVADVEMQAKKAGSLFAAQYSGMTVAELTDLRKLAREAGMYVRVVRNTLARRALKETKFAAMNDKLIGPLLLAFSGDDPGAAARLIQDFIKKCDRLQLKAVSLGGSVLSETALPQLASMPTRPEAIARLMGMLNAPITQFVRTLAEPHAKLVRTIAAIRSQKEAKN